MSVLIKLYLSKVWSFLRPFVVLFLTSVGQALAAAAVQAVATVGQTYATADGEVKRREAFRLIEQDLRRQGIQIGVQVTTSMINAALEAAVQKVKTDAAQ